MTKSWPYTFGLSTKTNKQTNKKTKNTITVSELVGLSHPVVLLGEYTSLSWIIIVEDNPPESASKLKITKHDYSTHPQT